MLCCCWSLLCSAVLRSRAESLRSHVILPEWLAFYSAFWNAHRSVVYLQRWHGWYHMELLPSRRVLCTPYNHAPCHFMQSHIRQVHACLAVTCHLRFLRNDRDLLRATAVTRGWNRYRNKSQHKKLTPKKKIFPSLIQGLEPGTFQSRVRRFNHWAIPARSPVWKLKSKGHFKQNRRRPGFPLISSSYWRRVDLCGQNTLWEKQVPLKHHQKAPFGQNFKLKMTNRA